MPARREELCANCDQPWGSHFGSTENPCCSPGYPSSASTPRYTPSGLARLAARPDDQQDYAELCSGCGNSFGEHFGGYSFGSGAATGSCCVRGAPDRTTPRFRPSGRRRLRATPEHPTGRMPGTLDVCARCGATYGLHAGWNCNRGGTWLWQDEYLSTPSAPAVTASARPPASPDNDGHCTMSTCRAALSPGTLRLTHEETGMHYCVACAERVNRAWKRAVVGHQEIVPAAVESFPVRATGLVSQTYSYSSTSVLRNYVQFGTTRRR